MSINHFVFFILILSLIIPQQSALAQSPAKQIFEGEAIWTIAKKSSKKKRKSKRRRGKKSGKKRRKK